MAIRNQDHLEDRVVISYSFTKTDGNLDVGEISIQYNTIDYYRPLPIGDSGEEVYLPKINKTIVLVERSRPETLVEKLKRMSGFFPVENLSRYEIYRKPKPVPVKSVACNAPTISPSQAAPPSDYSGSSSSSSSDDSGVPSNYENYTPGHGGTWGCR